MNLKAKLKVALARAAELKAVTGRDYTDDELTEIGSLDADIKDLREKIKRNDDAGAALKDLDLSEPGDDDDDEDEDGDDDPAPSPEPKSRRKGGTKTSPVSMGEAFIKSDAYKAFQKAYPSGLGNGSVVNIGRVKVGTAEDYFAGRKAALTSPLARVQPIRMPTVDLVDRNRLTLLDLVSRGQTAGNFEYVQITGVTRNAAIVPEATSATDAAALKPISDMATTIADAKVYTYADGYDVTNQLLSDAPAFASYMNNELEYSLDNVIEDKLLNGSGTSGEPRGILNTSGVQGKTYVAGAGLPVNPASAKAFIRSVRLAIRDIVRLPGGTVDAIVLSPELDAEIDLLQDDNGRYYSQGPFGSGPGTLWGRPRVTSERLADTTALLGDFKQVALLDREGLSVNAFNQHKDYAQRNMTYVRAELRAAQVIWKPSRLAVVTAVAS